MSQRILSLAALTVLELSPPEMVEVAARAGYSHVGLRLVPATPEEQHFPLVADAGLRAQTRQRLRDTGMLGIYAGTAEEKAGEIAPIIAGELAGMASGATDEETARARAQLKATLLMALESPHARCEQIATHLLAFGRVIPVPELIGRIDAVDAGVVRRFAQGVCARGLPAIAAVGPVKRLESREEFAARFG